MNDKAIKLLYLGLMSTFVGIEIWLYGQKKYYDGRAAYAREMKVELEIIQKELYEKYGIQKD